MRETKITGILRAWKIESGARRIIQYSLRSGILTLCTSEPGYLIGFRGCLVEKYEELLKAEIPGFVKVTFIDTAKNYI